MSCVWWDCGRSVSHNAKMTMLRRIVKSDGEGNMILCSVRVQADSDLLKIAISRERVRYRAYWDRGIGTKCVYVCAEEIPLRVCECMHLQPTSQYILV